MSKWPKIFLVMSVVTFGFGLTSVGSSIAYGILKPVGAILFMLFYLTQLLDKEVAKCDEEMRRERTPPKGNSASSAAPRSASVASGQVREAAALATGRSN